MSADLAGAGADFEDSIIWGQRGEAEDCLRDAVACGRLETGSFVEVIGLGVERLGGLCQAKPPLSTKPRPLTASSA